MTRKVKVGMTLAGSFAALIGGVFGVKAFTTHDKPAPAHVADARGVAPDEEKPEPFDPLPGKGDKPEKPGKGEKQPEKPGEKGVQPISLGELDPAPTRSPAALAPAPVKSEGKPEVKALTLNLDDPPTLTAPNKPSPEQKKPEPAKPEPGSLLSLDPPPTLPAKKNAAPVPPLKGDLEFTAPRELPKLAESGIQPVQGIEPVAPVTPAAPSTPMKADSPGLAPIGDLTPIKKDTEAIKPAPASAPAVGEIKLDLDAPPTPASKNLRLSVPGKDKEPEARPLATPEPITLGTPPKKEPEAPARIGLDLDPPMKKPEVKPEPITIPVAPVSPAPVSGGRPSLLDEPGPRTPEAAPLKATPEARLDNYDEDLHRPATSERYNSEPEKYRALSQKYYEDPRYADALRLYNGERRTNNGSVRIPPIDVLAKLYPNYVPQATRSGAAPTGEKATPIQATSAVAAPEAVGGSNAALATNTTTYVVPTGGEMLREVAQKTLGNAIYWSAIKELNPNVNELEKIPAGTRLLVPAR